MYKAFNPGTIGVKAGFEKAVELAGHNGFQGIYVSIPEIIGYGIEKAKTHMANHYLKPAAFGFPVEFRRSDEAFREGLAKLPALCEAAVQIGCLRTSTWIMPGSDQLSFKENFEFHRKRLAEIAKVLAPYKIRMGLEFVGPKTSRAGRKYEFIYTAQGMLELCDAIGTGNAGLLLDCWHWYTSGGTTRDFDTWTNKTVVDVHVNDAPKGIPVDQQRDGVRSMPGETGVIDIRGFLRGLQKIAYDGPVMVEPFSDRVRKMAEADAVRATIESLDKIWKIAGISK
jgi:sugar phosphate isomerase/epimerase